MLGSKIIKIDSKVIYKDEMLKLSREIESTN